MDDSAPTEAPAFTDPCALPQPEAQWAERNHIKALPQLWNMGRLDWLLGMWLVTSAGLTARDAWYDYRYLSENPTETATCMPPGWLFLTWLVLLLLFILAALALPALYRLCLRRQSGIVFSAIMAAFAFIAMVVSGIGGAIGVLLDAVVIAFAYKLVRCESCAALLPRWLRAKGQQPTP